MTAAILPVFVAFFLIVSAVAHAAATSERDARSFARDAEIALRPYVAQNAFSGVVIVATHGRPVFRRAYGLANREFGETTTIDAEYRIGSTTKQFTAAAVLLLLDRGRVQLNDPVSRYVSGLPPAWRGISLHQLLTHESGIPDFVQVSGFLRGPARLERSPEELLDLVRDQPLTFAPGTSYAYSNTDYVLLGMVIERASGEAFARFLGSSLFGPLGMEETAYDDASEIVRHRASGYWRDGGALRNARPISVSATFAAGGVRSTADDLLKWDRALHGGQLLRSSTIKAMFTDYGHGYGYGTFIDRREGHRLWDHGGDLPGFACAYDHYPDDDLTVIVLSNIEGSTAEKIAAELAKLFFGRQVRRDR